MFEATILRLIKVFDISLLGNYYFFMAVIISYLINKLFEKYEKEKYKKKSTLLIFTEIFLRVSLLVISVYFIRNIINIIPFPFDGYEGYDHHRVKERNGVVILAFAILIFQSDLKHVTLHLLDRLNL